MSETPSRYGPIIVAVLFGIVMGALFLMTGKILSGLFIWSLVALVIAHALSPDVSMSLLIATIAAVVYSGAFVYFAASSEITGKAIYYHSYGRVIVGEPVTRESSPVKFREATNYKWAASVVCLGIGTVTFLSHRKSDSADSV
jgi:hypothetical protein